MSELARATCPTCGHAFPVRLAPGGTADVYPWHRPDGSRIGTKESLDDRCPGSRMPVDGSDYERPGRPS